MSALEPSANEKEDTEGAERNIIGCQWVVNPRSLIE